MPALRAPLVASTPPGPRQLWGLLRISVLRASAAERRNQERLLSSQTRITQEGGDKSAQGHFAWLLEGQPPSSVMVHPTREATCFIQLDEQSCERQLAFKDVEQEGELHEWMRQVASAQDFSARYDCRRLRCLFSHPTRPAEPQSVRRPAP